jgi:hypothetical protein
MVTIMVLTNLGSRSNIKRCLKDAYVVIESEDYPSAIKVFDDLRFSLRIYYVTRGKSFQKFDDLFLSAMHTLLVGTNNHLKKDLMEEHLTNITNAIRDEVPTDPYERLTDLFEEIRTSYGSLADDRDAASNIIDCFDELNSFKDDFKDNIFFPLMTQYAADTIPLLIQVSKIERPPAALVMRLTDKFSAFFVAGQHVLVPPVKLNITREQILENLQSGISIHDIARSVGIAEDELRKMLEETSSDANNTD